MTTKDKTRERKNYIRMTALIVAGVMALSVLLAVIIR